MFYHQEPDLALFLEEKEQHYRDVVSIQTQCDATDARYPAIHKDMGITEWIIKYFEGKYEDIRRQAAPAFQHLVWSADGVVGCSTYYSKETRNKCADLIEKTVSKAIHSGKHGFAMLSDLCDAGYNINKNIVDISRQNDVRLYQHAVDLGLKDGVFDAQTGETRLSVAIQMTPYYYVPGEENSSHSREHLALLMLADGADPTGGGTNMPLIHAVVRGKERIVEALIEAGAVVDAETISIAEEHIAQRAEDITELQSQANQLWLQGSDADYDRRASWEEKNAWQFSNDDQEKCLDLLKKHVHAYSN